MTLKLFGTALLVTAAVIGCTGVPKGLQPVSEFDVDRYLGRWYEIARLDHSFERNLSNVSATYARNDSGDISVTNRGYNEKTGQWKQVQGKARFIGDETVGSLKVSFLGPFYGGYHIIELDHDNYEYAMVAGPNRSYLWILSRSASMEPSILTKLKGKATGWGFETSNLIVVNHDRVEI